MENTPEEIVNWRVNTVMCGTWASPGYLYNDGYHTPENDQKATEITLGQFVYNEAYETCQDGTDDDFIDKPKQPLKQVIYCTTQAEWDFVSEKIGYTFSTPFNSVNKNTINPSAYACSNRSHYESLYNQYQILSFQEWCDLNGYKMESKCDFIIGRWYKSTAKENNRSGETYYGKFLSYDNGSFTATWHSVANNFTEQVYTFSNGYKWELMTDLSEIQQYLPEGHPDLVNTVNKEVKYVSETFTIRVTSREVKRINI